MIAALLPTLLLSGAETPPASRTPVVGPKEIEHLIDRIDRHHELLRKKRFADAYGMIGSDWRGSEKEQKEWIDYQRQSERGMRVESWHVKRMWLSPPPRLRRTGAIPPDQDVPGGRAVVSRPGSVHGLQCLATGS